ncbi:MAG: hypothetical protein R3E53_02180 [Myxococcota bacterium]
MAGHRAISCARSRPASRRADSVARSPRTASRRSKSAPRIPYDDLLLLADGLGCDPSDLLADDGLASANLRGPLH